MSNISVNPNLRSKSFSWGISSLVLELLAKFELKRSGDGFCTSAKSDACTYLALNQYKSGQRTRPSIIQESEYSKSLYTVKHIQSLYTIKYRCLEYSKDRDLYSQRH